MGGAKGTGVETHMSVPNAVLRLLLELTALYGIALLGRVLGGLPVGVFLVIAAAWVWGRFRVPDDPGPAPVAVSGVTRLVIEAVVLGAGAVGLAVGADPVWARGFTLGLAVHYLTTPRRLRWMLSPSAAGGDDGGGSQALGDRVERPRDL